MTPDEYGDVVRARVGDWTRRTCRSTSTCSTRRRRPAPARPRWPGSSRREALAFLRALAGMPFTGFDVVEVAPPYDSPGQITALNAAAIAYDLLALLAVARSRHPPEDRS